MFIVEDGTGVPDANAYVDESFVENYFMSDRLARFNELSNKESVIVQATQLVDISYEWKGTRSSLEQGLSWPRDDVEVEGFAISDIPAALKKAVCEAVWIAMNNENLFSSDNQREVVKESIAGVVSVEYASASEKGREAISRYEILDKIVRPLIQVTSESANGSSLVSVPVERV